MPTPCRRSSRIRAASATPAKLTLSKANGLTSLPENEESPGARTAIVDDNNATTAPQTPATGNIKPIMGEMHPSKVKQSTTKEPEPAFRFGSVDFASPSAQPTPSKSMAGSSFEFRFARPGPQLSANAQKMMDDLREEAMRVKARLMAERKEAARKTEIEANSIGGRKMAQPKGKVGRFSDIHMAEFKKMDSIADHPSSFRAQLGRITPAKPTLKRTQSQAKLDERESITTEQSSKMFASTQRLENDAPAKRARKAFEDDIASSKHASAYDRPIPKPSSSLPMLTTPTKSSLARTTSTKKPSTQNSALSKSSLNILAPSTPRSTQIPALSKSTSKSSLLITPQAASKQSRTFNFGNGPQSEPKAFIRSPGKVDRLKSMLRYPSASARKPAATRSALPVFSLSPSKPNYHKALPSIPTTPSGTDRAKTKHVTFTPDTVVKNAVSVQMSPSPAKLAIPRSIIRGTAHRTTPSRIKIGSSKNSEISYPSIADHPSLREGDRIVEYPSLTGVRPLPSPPRQASDRAHGPPSVPGTFTFRSDHTISFGASPTSFGPAAGQASVRQVRPSNFSEMPGSFPLSNKENTPPIPSIPHGIPNKKRHRASSEEEDRGDDSRSAKKVKTDFTYGSSLASHAVESPKHPATKNISSPTKKKGLTLSRLNMLAKPKSRK